MPKIIEAVYEDGVFKPLGNIELKEGEKVRIRIELSRKERRLRFLKELKPIKMEKRVTVEDIEKLRLEKYESVH